MWFMNKIVNPLMSWILLSPFHKLMSASVLLLTYCGLKSHKSYRLPVQYVQDGKMIYILPGMPEKKVWWRNLRGGAPVEIMLAGKHLAGHAEVLPENADPALAAGILAKYFQRFPPSARLHGLQPLPDGSYNREDLLALSSTVKIVSVRL